MKKILILIPCYNEEKGISKVLNNIPRKLLEKYGFEVKVTVIDNNSTDNTALVARLAGANIIKEEKKGKGYAIRRAFESIDSQIDYVVMLDGDDTYKSHEIPRLIEPLNSGFCDVIIGSRLGGKTLDGSLKLPNRLANWFYTFLVRHFYRANVTDVLSGFFAWRKETLDNLRLHLDSDGFAIEMEMITKIVKLGYRIYSVPITYDVRQGNSKIEPLKDGLRILKMFFQNLFWTPVKSSNKKITIKIGFWTF